MPVIAAVELDDLVALREPPRQADGRHARLGARVAHPHLLHAGHPAANHLCQRDLERVRDAEARAGFRRRLDGLDNPGMRMAEDGRPPGADVVDILIAVHVPHPRAFRFVDEERLAADGAERPHRRVHTAGDVLERLGKELLGFSPRSHGGIVRGSRARVEGKSDSDALPTSRKPEWSVVRACCSGIAPVLLRYCEPVGPLYNRCTSLVPLLGRTSLSRIRALAIHGAYG